MRLIVGLGNPGKMYINTRHNIGFAVIGTVAKKLGVTWKRENDLHSDIAEVNIDGEKVVLAKPQTFMNLSGDAVAAVAERFGIEPKDIWVIVDEFQLPTGTLRVRNEGSAGGHNGMKSIIESLGTQAFPRFRVGIGMPPDGFPLEKYVLSRFPLEERKAIDEAIRKTADVVLDSIKGGITETTA
jgi:PTH1 family peptidyl-tRNA hydrolase